MHDLFLIIIDKPFFAGYLKVDFFVFFSNLKNLQTSSDARLVPGVEYKHIVVAGLNLLAIQNPTQYIWLTLLQAKLYMSEDAMGI